MRFRHRRSRFAQRLRDLLPKHWLLCAIFHRLIAAQRHGAELASGPGSWRGLYCGNRSRDRRESTGELVLDMQWHGTLAGLPVRDIADIGAESRGDFSCASARF